MLTSLCSRPECWQGGLFRNRICGWYWRSRPPIRINDISSWSYDIDTMDFMNTVSWNGYENFFIDIPVANELYMLKMIFQRKKHVTWIISVLCFGKFSQRHVWAYSFHPMRRFWWHARAHGVFLKSNARLQNLTLWWKFTIACRVEHIHRKPLKMHNYEYQTHHQTQFWSQAIKPSRSSTAAALVAPSTSAMEKHHNIWVFVDVSNYMIGKVYKRLNFI